MRTMHQWLDEYGASHRNATNEFLHWICVPVIALTVVGFLWSIPVPDSFARISPWLNWATMGVALWIAYYFLLSPSLGVGATLCLLAMLFIVRWMDTLPWPPDGSALRGRAEGSDQESDGTTNGKAAPSSASTPGLPFRSA